MGFDLSKLGVTKNIPRVNFLEYSGLIQAPPKWGKTTMASMYPKCILGAVEKGYKAKQVDYVDISTWEKFVTFVDSLYKNRREIADNIQTIAIDTVDRLYPECQKYIVDRYNRTNKRRHKARSIAEIPHGKGWGEADEEFLNQLTRILDMQFTLLFLTHNKITQVTPEDGEPYDKYVATMPKRCQDLIFPLVDFIINGEHTSETIGGVKKTTRLMRLQGNSMANAGSRVQGIDAVIKFDTEQEALRLFSESFKMSIEENIRKSGIDEPFSSIEERQIAENAKELEEYLSRWESEHSDTEEDLEVVIGEIREEVGRLRQKNREDAAAKAIRELNSGSANYTQITNLELAKKVLEKIKTL